MFKFYFCFFTLICVVSSTNLRQKSASSIQLFHSRGQTQFLNQLEQKLDKIINSEKKIICYYGSWATYRPGTGRVAVDMIDPFACTHIIYRSMFHQPTSSFFGLSSKFELISLDPWNDFAEPKGLGSLRELSKLRNRNPNLKVLVSVGGWNEGSRNYSRMASYSWSRAKFIKSVLKFLNQHQLDGLDLDWEYPNYRGGKRDDKGNYVELLRELKWAFKPRGYLLTAAVPAGREMIDGGFDVAAVAENLDAINLMTYDFHGAWDGKTGLNAPLYDADISVDWSVRYWLRLGATREKLMLGLGFYGRSFTLNLPHQYGLGGPASRQGRPGPYTKSRGTLSYHEICLAVSRGGWKQKRSSESTSTCYAFDGHDQWVSFDDSQSIRQKVRYARRLGLGGVMIWSIDQDDYSGLCKRGEKRPLMRSVLEEMNH